MMFLMTTFFLFFIHESLNLFLVSTFQNFSLLINNFLNSHLLLTRKSCDLLIEIIIYILLILFLTVSLFLNCSILLSLPLFEWSNWIMLSSLQYRYVVHLCKGLVILNQIKSWFQCTNWYSFINRFIKHVISALKFKFLITY